MSSDIHSTPNKVLLFALVHLPNRISIKKPIKKLNFKSTDFSRNY